MPPAVFLSVAQKEKKNPSLIKLLNCPVQCIAFHDSLVLLEKLLDPNILQS